MKKLAKLQVVGFGPAALGLFVAADRDGELESLIEQGICVHERCNSLEQWQSLEYQITSNSPARDFVVGIRPDGAFAECLDSRALRRWAENADTPVPLLEVSAFIRQLLQVVMRRVELSKRSAVLWGSHIESVQRRPRSYHTGTSRHGEVQSGTLVLACGADVNDDMASEVRHVKPLAIIASDMLLRGRCDAAVANALESGRPVLVVGGSHSGFSVIGYLLEKYDSRLPEAGLHLYSRRLVKQWYPRDAAPQRLGSHDQVNRHTGEINKFSGLRGSARETFARITAGVERRVGLHVGLPPIVAAAELATLQGALVINATGYRARVPCILDDMGRMLTLDEDSGNVCKDQVTHELMHAGRPVPRLFGLGLGFADHAPDGFQVGVNFFHGAAAENILCAIGSISAGESAYRAVSAADF